MEPEAEGIGDISNSPKAECPLSSRPPVPPQDGSRPQGDIGIMSLMGTDKLCLKVPSQMVSGVNFV